MRVSLGDSARVFGFSATRLRDDEFFLAGARGRTGRREFEISRLHGERRCQINDRFFSLVLSACRNDRVFAFRREPTEHGKLGQVVARIVARAK